MPIIREAKGSSGERRQVRSWNYLMRVHFVHFSIEILEIYHIIYHIAIPETYE